MKYLVLSLLLVSFVSYGAGTVTKKTLPVSKDKLIAEQEVKIKDKKEEDCDEKAKKKVEIKEDSINLLGGNTGCSLDEAH